MLNFGQHLKCRLVYIANGVRQGNHWTLLALNTKQKVVYYGDFTEMGNSKVLTHTIEPLLSKYYPSQEKNELMNLNMYPFSPSQPSPMYVA